jgi:hypothetical protein
LGGTKKGTACHPLMTPRSDGQSAQQPISGCARAS